MAETDQWYSTARWWSTTDPIEDLNLGWVGPAAEDDPEEGLEASLRGVTRYTFSDASAPEESLPDTEALWLRELERDKSGYAQKEVALLKAAQREAEYQKIQRYHRLKAQAKVQRRAQQLAEWRARMREKYPDDPRWKAERV